MAQKRMFSLQIVDTDAFLEMPLTTQLLYFHLTMRADDEGFVGSPRKIMKMCGFQDDDLKILIAKRFVLSFESGVVVIKHWLIHNTIRMDRFNETSYLEEKKLLKINENRSYTDQMATTRQPNDNQMEPQVKLSKVKLIKDKDLSTSLEFLQNIPDDVIQDFSNEFNVYEKGIRGKADDLYNYCLAKGKRYKNYKAFLRNAVKKDFGLRPQLDQEQQERIKATLEKNQTSQFAQSLKNKFQIKK